MARARPQDWKSPDYTEVFRERLERARRIRALGASGWNAIVTHYRDEPVDFIEDWLFTYDPRALATKKTPWRPFVLFPHQQQLVVWLLDRFERKEPGIVEKSRDTGVSWVCLAFSLWLWMFRYGAKIAVGSRKEALVDRLGDPDSLLERVRMMVRMLPPELRPLGYDEKKHALYMRLQNPETGSIITGEAGDNIGRGGRSSIYFLDEAAFIDNPERVDAALSQNTTSLIRVSTPNGTGNPFYRLRHSGMIPVFTFHWTRDPRKDQAWYDEQKRTLEPEVLAQEVDLDYEASAGNVVISGKWVQASKALRKHLEAAGEMPPRRDGVAGLDVGGGTAKSVFVPRWGPIVGKSEDWTDDDTTDTANRGRDLALKARCPVLKFDAIGVGKGVASTLRRLRGVEAHGITVGDRPTLTRWPDGKRSRQKFANLRAELWWVAREALRKTYEHWLFLESGGTAGQLYPIDELLLLPDDANLCGQLSVPHYRKLDSGKIAVERKEQMKARGVASPDHADALMLTFAPEPERVHRASTVGSW